MVHGMDLTDRGPLSEIPFSMRPYEKDMDWLRAEARRQGVSVATVVRLIIAKHIDSLPSSR